jgi:hypothetical protein
MSRGSLFRSQEDRRGFINAINDNTGRHAIAYGHFDTTGSGEITNDLPFKFGVQYIDRPAVAYSYSIDEDDLVDTVWPRCWGGISTWHQDNRDLYVGATAFVIVDATAIVESTVTEDPWYTITHYFTFNGIALKFVTTDFSAYRVAQ